MLCSCSRAHVRPLPAVPWRRHPGTNACLPAASALPQEGVKFALRHGGRVLIGDEMGLVRRRSGVAEGVS